MGMAIMQKRIQSSIKNKGVIDLRNEQLDDGQIKILKKKKTENVKRVYLSHIKITSLGVKNLSQCNWNNLFDLSLMSNLIKDKGCKYLIKISMPSIGFLELNLNQIGETGMSHLCKAQWKTLQHGFSINRKQVIISSGMTEQNYYVKLIGREQDVKSASNMLNKYQAINLLLIELKQIVFLNIKDNHLSDSYVLTEKCIMSKFANQKALFYYIGLG